MKMKNYSDSFNNFLRCTEEKKIFLYNLSKYIKKLGINSLLDIGAGNGKIAIPLSKKVNFYVAIEKNKLFVNKLKSKGIEVIKEEFPKENIKLKREFDLVLCSYVLQHDKNFRKFIFNSWRYVSSKGYLLIITHRLSSDEFGKLCKKIKFKNYFDKPYFFPKLIKYLKNLGKVSIKEVITTIKSKNPEEFISALAFVASQGEKDKENLFYKNKRIIRKVISRYYKKEFYEFPTKHYFILCKKS